MSNRTLYFIITLLVLFITGLLLRVALENQMMVEFWVSEFAVITVAISCAYVLREPDENQHRSENGKSK